MKAQAACWSFAAVGVLLWNAVVVVAQEPEGGKLLVVGGGKTPDSVLKTFFDLAGGKDGRVVVVPSASGKDEFLSSDYTDKVWGKRGFTSVKTLHAKTKEEADDEKFLDPLKNATAVWLGGGNQNKLFATYQGTKVEKELHAVLKRGGLVAGTSAGAAVMSRTMIGGGKETPTLAKGFGFLADNVLVDQHFLKNNRINRLLEALRQRPELIGVGIDESTALLVRNDRATVVGDSYVLLFEPNKDGPRVTVLKSGQSTTKIMLPVIP